MSTITAIESQRKSTQRVNLYIDGAFACGLALEVVMKQGLKKGLDLTEDALTALIHDDQAWQAKEAALRLLDVRARAKGELRQRLRQKKFPGDVIEDVLADLEKSGLINDAAFAKMLVHDLSLKAVGKRRLQQALRAKGIDRAVEETTLQEAVSEENQEEACRAAAQKRAARYRGLDPATARRRLYAYLTRQGFEHGIVSSIIRTLGTTLGLTEDDNDQFGD